jgi:hypothetical protein
VPPWALRVLAAVITTGSMLGSTGYALAHPKNPNAPLQPPVAGKPSPTPEPTPEPLTIVLPTATLPRVTPSPSPTAAAATALPARASGAPPTTAAPTRTAAPTPTPRPTPVPQITLRAGVRATALPSISYTHVS